MAISSKIRIVQFTFSRKNFFSEKHAMCLRPWEVIFFEIQSRKIEVRPGSSNCEFSPLYLPILCEPGSGKSLALYDTTFMAPLMEMEEDLS